MLSWRPRSNRRRRERSRALPSGPGESLQLADSLAELFMGLQPDHAWMKVRHEPQATFTTRGGHADQRAFGRAGAVLAASGNPTQARMGLRICW